MHPLKTKAALAYQLANSYDSKLVQLRHRMIELESEIALAEATTNSLRSLGDKITAEFLRDEAMR